MCAINKLASGRHNRTHAGHGTHGALVAREVRGGLMKLELAARLYVEHIHFLGGLQQSTDARPRTSNREHLCSLASANGPPDGHILRDRRIRSPRQILKTKQNKTKQLAKSAHR
jgi:hypothetical protein